MCAIVGQVRVNGGIDSDTLSFMRDKMSHRGPDDAGLFLNEAHTVGLGHRRLSIIDLSRRATSP